MHVATKSQIRIVKWMVNSVPRATKSSSQDLGPIKAWRHGEFAGIFPDKNKNLKSNFQTLSSFTRPRMYTKPLWTSPWWIYIYSWCTKSSTSWDSMHTYLYSNRNQLTHPTANRYCQVALAPTNRWRPSSPGREVRDFPMYVKLHK